MASGRLGAAAPPADTHTTVYTVPADTAATLNIAVVNRGSDPATVRVAVTATTNPADADWIEYDAVVPAGGGVLERSGIVAGPGERVIVRDDAGTCTYRIHGFEGSA
ncbi:hypothetical protein F1188_19885 [Roseospira marina]|uniref:Uncharacterized protein n=1 Tax=Roseospira marina TaxID=140057 RepID=A0A5M6I510_9PROT|nr:hypothetical protein [Roseospira marina]KAA5603243.1 hypothetical protein F1188_19885 [Roseospira marina]MBB4316178.1 hypothetical protein [Roseospira marina]MBB5089377.1 hypothetical protein [Roseospira marina]